MKRIIESGHYYQAKGPTIWSQIGWNILNHLKNNDDKAMLFVDDVHSFNDVSEEEVNLPCISFNPDYDHLVLESDVIKNAFIINERLKSLPKKSRSQLADNGTTFCSGFPIMRENHPTCVLLDSGLMLTKYNLGFDVALNILPFFYEEEQRKLKRIVAKAIPEIQLEVVLYNLKGEFWNADL